MKKTTKIMAAIGASIICAASCSLSAFAKPEPIVPPENSVTSVQDVGDAAVSMAEQANQDLQDLAGDIMGNDANAASEEENEELNALAQQVMNAPAANLEERAAEKRKRTLKVVVLIFAIVAAAGLILFALFSKKMFNSKSE